MSANEIMDLLLCECMQILELVQGREFDHVQAVRGENVRLAL